MKKIKINRRVRLAIRTYKSAIAKRIKKYRAKMDAIIESNGYFIQGVANGVASFTYTIGRTRKSQPELIIPSWNNQLVGLFDEVIAGLESGEIQLYQPFKAKQLVCQKTNEPTIAIVVHATADDFETKMRGVHNEFQRAIPQDGVWPKPPIKILVADIRNRLPPNLQTPLGLEEAKKKGLAQADLFDSWINFAKASQPPFEKEPLGSATSLIMT